MVDESNDIQTNKSDLIESDISKSSTCSKNITLEDRVGKQERQIVTLKELFSGRTIFIIPDYQRGYAWNKQCEDMWDDIMRLFNSGVKNKNHYTGLLVLNQLTEAQKNTENKTKYDAFYIVDGQQRLTTLYIYLKFIISRMEELKEIDDCECNVDFDNLIVPEDKYYKTYRVSYSKNRSKAGSVDSQEFFISKVFCDGSKEEQDAYMRNISYVCDYIKRELYQFTLSDLDEIRDIILNRIVFSLYVDYVSTGENDNDFDVRMTFETMNNRGKKLSTLELLKNRMMYLGYHLIDDGEGDDQSEFADFIDENWNKIYYNLAKVRRDENGNISPLSDDDFLYIHWYIYYNPLKGKRDACIHDLFDEKFSIDKMISHDHKQGIKTIRKYVESLAKCSEYWAYINYPDAPEGTFTFNIDFEEQRYLCELKCVYVNFYIQAVLMVTAMTQLEEKNRQEKYDLYEELIKFLFINFDLLSQTNDLSFLGTIASKFYRDNIENNNNQIVFESASINFISNLKSAITKYDNDYTRPFTKDYWINNKDEFKTEIQKKFINKCFDNGFYRTWSGLRYFLYKYDSKFGAEYSGSKLSPGDMFTSSIEHIFPEHPSTEYWKKVAELSYHKLDSDGRKKQEKKLMHLLGNLVMLQKKEQNSSLSNRCFPIKTGHYQNYEDGKDKLVKATYSTANNSARAISDSTSKQDVWTPDLIKERTDAMLKSLWEDFLKDYIPSLDDWKNMYQKRLNSCLGGYHKLTKADRDSLKTIANEEIKKLPTKSNNGDNKFDFWEKFKNYFNPSEFKIYSGHPVKQIQLDEETLHKEDQYVIRTSSRRDGTLKWVRFYTKDKNTKDNNGNLEWGLNNLDDEFIYIKLNYPENIFDTGHEIALTKNQYDCLESKNKRFINLFVNFLQKELDKPFVFLSFADAENKKSPASDVAKENHDFPKLNSIIEATFKALKQFDGPASNDDIKNGVISILNLTSDQVNLKHTTNSQTNASMTALDYSLTWARTYLGKYSGIIKNTSKGMWEINEKYLDKDKIDGTEIIQKKRLEGK